MKPTTIITWVVSAIVLIGLLVWAVQKLTVVPSMNGSETATSTETSTTGSTTGSGTVGSGTSGGTTSTGTNLGETYTNATYKFSISYPKNLDAGTFGNFHLLNQNDWRINATAQKRGTPVVEIPVVRVDNSAAGKKQYPPYYIATVRVGISTDTAQCYSTDEGFSNQTVTSVTIGGVAWKKFTFSDAAMQQYKSGASYRTIHNNLCYVVEQIENGSHYTDETYTTQYTDAQLRAFYAQTTPIVMSFRFTK